MRAQTQIELPNPFFQHIYMHARRTFKSDEIYQKVTPEVTVEACYLQRTCVLSEGELFLGDSDALLNFPNATAKVFSNLFIHLSAYSQFMHFRRFLSVVENSFPQSSQIFSYSGIIFHLVLL